MTASVMPAPMLNSTTILGTMGSLLHNLDGHARDLRGQRHPAQRWVCGWPLPAFQRELVWSEAQSARFIESAWLGLALGTYVVNDWMLTEQIGEGERSHPLAGLLIDGQQRLAAVERYLCGELRVFGYTYDELPVADQRRFGMVKFACEHVRITDETELRELYNRLNFGGTPHTEAQRALL